MAEPLRGWAAPVFVGMAQPPQYKGVPLLFFAADLLGSLFGALCLLQIEPVYSVVMLLVGIGLYGVVYLGAMIDPQWAGLLWDYYSYDTTYEA